MRAHGPADPQKVGIVSTSCPAGTMRCEESSRTGSTSQSGCIGVSSIGAPSATPAITARAQSARHRYHIDKHEQSPWCGHEDSPRATELFTKKLSGASPAMRCTSSTVNLPSLRDNPTIRNPAMRPPQRDEPDQLLRRHRFESLRARQSNASTRHSHSLWHPSTHGQRAQNAAGEVFVAWLER